MANSPYILSRPGTGAMDTSVDAGLRAFMLGVYNKMALGLVLSAVLAYVVGTVAPITSVVLQAPVVYLVQWGPVVLLLGSAFLMRNPSPLATNILYWTVVSLIGSGLGVWVYAAATGAGLQTTGGATLSLTFETIARAFFMTAAAFGALSLWAYTTKRNITGIGSFLFMAMIGLVLISLLNVFIFKSGMLEIGLQVAGLLIFAALIAFQTQQLKMSYYEMQGDARGLAVMTTMGALNLYIAFVQIFQTLLSFLSSRE